MGSIESVPVAELYLQAQEYFGNQGAAKPGSHYRDDEHKTFLDYGVVYQVVTTAYRASYAARSFRGFEVEHHP